MTSAAHSDAGSRNSSAIEAAEDKARTSLAAQAVAAGHAAPDNAELNNLLFELQYKIVRNQVLGGHPRIDGRDTRTVRPIAIRNGVLPRAHGSALFTRGETQALAVATLGTARDEQIIDSIGGEYKEHFMMQYNMPPFATGETGRFGAPKRREVGHGRLARRALNPLIPSKEEFGYSIRVVSEPDATGNADLRGVDMSAIAGTSNSD